MLNPLIAYFKDIFTKHDAFEIFKTIATAITVFIAIASFIRRIVQNNRYLKLNLSGYFISKRKFNKSGKLLYDVVKIKAKFYNIVGRPIYIFKDQDYKLKLSFSREHYSVINGDWKSLKDSKNYGSFGWNYTDEKLFGFWSSATRKGNIDFGDWELDKINQQVAKQIVNELSPSIFFILKRYFNKLFKKRNLSCLYDNIISKHANEPTKAFLFRGRTYDIYSSVFNPQFGKIGRPLIEYLLDKYDFSQFSSVLEWGTGCGYYSIEIALKFKELCLNSKILAIENSPNSIYCAHHNISKHNVSHSIKLKLASRISDVVNFEDESFQLIIANLPFSRPETLEKHKNSEMYGCFSASSQLIFNMCFEIKNFLHKDGIALITFADSGNESFFTNCLELADLEAKELFRIDKTKGATDDVFYAYEIKHR